MNRFFRPILTAFNDSECLYVMLGVGMSDLDSLEKNGRQERRFRRGLGPTAAKMPFGPQTCEGGEVSVLWFQF